MCQLTEILNGYPKKHGITIEELAEKMGYECSSTLGRHLNPNDEKRPFPASKLLLLCRACNNDFSAIDHLNARAGRIAIPLPQTGEEVDTDGLLLIAKILSEAVSVTVDVARDGKIDPTEKVRLSKTFFDLTQVLHGAMGDFNNWNMNE